MSKTQSQKELLEKIKPGVKASDLKKERKKNVKPKLLEKDEGYSSDEEKIPKAPPLPNQNLLDQISSLKKLLQTYKDFKEADLKIKEKYKEEIKKLQEENKKQYKTIQDLKKQVKNKEENKGETEKIFICYNCKKQQQLSLLVLELPEGKLCKSCWQLFRKKTKQNKEPQAFICIVCEKPKQETPIYKKVDISYRTDLIKGKEYPVCSACLPHIKEYNENENRELDIWE